MSDRHRAKLPMTSFGAAALFEHFGFTTDKMVSTATTVLEKLSVR